MINIENSFSPADLLHYAEMLLKQSKLREASIQHCMNHYSWLTSRHIQNDIFKTDEDLETLRPMIQKMSSESCAKIAVKLDSLTDDGESTTVILSTFKQLLEEHFSMQLMDKNVNKAKERMLKKNRFNKVHPVLVPDGRQPTVSFVLYY